jgi:hypothetical protein
MTSRTQIIEDAVHCAHLFRLGRDIEGALKMVDVIDAAMPLFSARPIEDQAHLARIMSAILQSQECQDWLAVADALEYELVAIV